MLDHTTQLRFCLNESSVEEWAKNFIRRLTSLCVPQSDVKFVKQINPQEEECKELAVVGFEERNANSLRQYAEFLDDFDQSLKLELRSLESELNEEKRREAEHSSNVF